MQAAIEEAQEVKSGGSIPIGSLMCTNDAKGHYAKVPEEDIIQNKMLGFKG